MTKEDVIFYFTIFSGAAFIPTCISTVYTALMYHRKPIIEASEMSSAAPLTSSKLPARFWILAACSSLLYAGLIYGTVIDAGRRGPQGQMGETGLQGAPGPIGPAGAKGEPGRAGNDANTKAFENKLNELATSVSQIQQKADEAIKDAGLLRRYIKVKDCLQNLNGVESELKIAFDREVEKITPPKPSANSMPQTVIMRAYRMQPDFSTLLSQDLTKIKSCLPSYNPRLTELNEDQLETSVPNEPKESFDQQRKYRRINSKNSQIFEILITARQALVNEEQNIKTTIDN